MSEQPTDDFAAFCEMLRMELKPLTTAKFGRGANAMHRVRMAILFSSILGWLDEHHPQEES